MFTYLLDAFSGPGSFFMWAITAILAFGLAVLLERSWTLMLRFRPGMAGVRAALAAGDPEAARGAARAGPVADVLAAGLDSDDKEAAWDAMGAAAAYAEERINARVAYLATIGNVATMMGLLGTVYGLIMAFSALGDTAAAERAVRLSEGISTAMATTAYGLLVGIPALLAHTWLDARAQALLSSVEEVASRVALLKQRAP